jgi:hypothetical protein
MWWHTHLRKGVMLRFLRYVLVGLTAPGEQYR